MATGKRSGISLTRRSCVLLNSATRIFIAKYKCRQIRLRAFLGPFHFISTPPPPMEEVNQNLPPKNQRSKVPTRAPHPKLCKFSFPLRKKAIFFQTPRKYLKDQRRRRSHPLRNDVQGPPQKISSIRGMWILNGMAPCFKANLL